MQDKLHTQNIVVAAAIAPLRDDTCERSGSAPPPWGRAFSSVNCRMQIFAHPQNVTKHDFERCKLGVAVVVAAAVGESSECQNKL